MAEVLSGVITVATAGTAVQGTSVNGRRFVLKALSTNSGIIYVGNDGAGDVASGNGFALGVSEAVEVSHPLAAYWFDTSSSGDKVAWLRVE